MKSSTAAMLSKILRYVLLASILILTTVLGRLHGINKAVPPIDSFCPFGGLESLAAVISQGVFLRRVALGSLILFITTVSLALVFRRTFCGRICPLGFLQELFGKLGKLLFRGRKPAVPSWLISADKYLRYLKYAVLAFFIGITWYSGILAIRAYDPWVAYHHLFSDELLTSYGIGFAILILSLLSSLAVERSFCRYLCPMGGFLGLVSKAGLFRIRRNEDTCIDCGDCGAACPVAIPVQDLAAVTSAECISCGACTQACPVESTLQESTPKGRLSLKPLAVFLISSVLFIGVVGITTATGDFSWNRYGHLPKTFRQLLWGPSFISEENTLLEIVYAYQIPPQMLVTRFGLSEASEFETPLSDMGIKAKDVKEIVQTYMDDYGIQSNGESCSGDH